MNIASRSICAGLEEGKPERAASAGVSFGTCLRQLQVRCGQQFVILRLTRGGVRRPKGRHCRDRRGGGDCRHHHIVLAGIVT